MVGSQESSRLHHKAKNEYELSALLFCQNPNLLTSPHASPSSASTEEKNISILISDSLILWLETKNLQGYIRIAEASPHPNAEELVQHIDIAKITNKQVRRTLKWRILS